MKQILFFLTLLLGAYQFAAQAEETAKPLKYVNATELKIINKGFTDTEGAYTRLPKWIKDSIRPTLWDRGLCSAGIAIRFSTNSKRIGIKYKLLWDAHMLHMADTGIKGTDLYRLSDNGVWEYVNTNRPAVNNKEDKQCEKIYVENLAGDTREFMIYLPLYDSVTECYVGIDEDAEIGMPKVDNPRSDKKIVMYGTSIMQGGCASHTGMTQTNILQRRLNCEIVNLGFSGEGKMDNVMARAIAQIADADVIVLDPIPNCTEMMCDTLTYDFVNIIRKARPEIPIVMVEGPIYPYAKFDSFFRDYLPRKNAAFRKNYERLKAENKKNLYYVDCEGLAGKDSDGTVDGIHFTDLGFKCYADKLYPLLKKLLKNK